MFFASSVPFLLHLGASWEMWHWSVAEQCCLWTDCVVVSLTRTPLHRHTHRHRDTDTHRHTQTHTDTDTHTLTHTHTHWHTHTDTHRHTGTHTDTHTHTLTHTHTHTHTDTHTHTHWHTHTGTHTHTHWHTHTNTHTSARARRGEGGVTEQNTVYIWRKLRFRQLQCQSHTPYNGWRPNRPEGHDDLPSRQTWWPTVLIDMMTCLDDRHDVLPRW